MKLSSSSQSFDALFLQEKMDLISFIKYAKDVINLDGVEFEDKHFANTSDEYIGSLKDSCKTNNLEICNMAFFNSFGYPTKEQNDQQLEAAYKWLDVAKGLGSKNMRIFAGWMGGDDMEIGFKGSILPKTDEAFNNMVSYVKKVCEKGAEMGINIVVENHNHGGFLSTSDDVLRLFKDVNNDNLSLLLDTGNFADGISGIEKTIKLAKFHMHLKCRDIQPDGSDAAFDLEKIIHITKTSGYNGNISLEYEGTQDTMVVIPKLVSFVRKYI